MNAHIEDLRELQTSPQSESDWLPQIIEILRNSSHSKTIICSVLHTRKRDSSETGDKFISILYRVKVPKKNLNQCLLYSVVYKLQKRKQYLDKLRKSMEVSRIVPSSFSPVKKINFAVEMLDSQFDSKPFRYFNYLICLVFHPKVHRTQDRRHYEYMKINKGSLHFESLDLKSEEVFLTNLREEYGHHWREYFHKMMLSGGKIQLNEEESFIYKFEVEKYGKAKKLMCNWALIKD